MKEFQLQGINHLALVCKDIARTLDFYSNTLGLSLIKTIGTFISSFYFFDPDGILLEFAANARKLGDPVRDLQPELVTVANQLDSGV